MSGDSFMLAQNTPAGSSNRKSALTNKPTHELDAALQNRLESIQDKLLDALHDAQSLTQVARNNDDIASLTASITHIQLALSSVTTDWSAEAEIKGPINWKLFGERLYHRRSEAKLSQKEVGAKSGVTGTFIRYIENAVKHPSRKTLLRLLAIPELKMKVSDVTQRSPDGVETTWLPTAYLAPRYDPVRMMMKMTSLLSGSGGQLEQSLIYLEPQSAADWMATSNTAAYSDAYRSIIPFPAIAKSISDFAGQSMLEINALGCGDGKTEVMLVKRLSDLLPSRSGIRLNLLDVSHSLLIEANTHANAVLEGVSVFAIHGDFHELPSYPQGQPKSRPICRLFTMLGYTLVNLQDEVRFFRDTLSGCDTGDLFLVDILTVAAPPEQPDEILRLDPALRAKQLRSSHEAWLSGPIRRHCAGATDVKFNLELDTQCPVPGSYGIDVIATVTMSGGKPQRRFLMQRFRRYDPQKLADTLAAVGWEQQAIFLYGADDSKSLAALLFRKR